MTRAPCTECARPVVAKAGGHGRSAAYSTGGQLRPPGSDIPGPYREPCFPARLDFGGSVKSRASRPV